MLRQHILALFIALAFVTLACNTGTGPSTATSTPLPTDTLPAQATDPCALSEELGTNVATEKPIVSRAGGITYRERSDSEEYSTTTHPHGGRWLNETNAGNGTYQVVDLGKVYKLTGIGYGMMWDDDYVNSLTFQVAVSLDRESWTVVSEVVYRHTADSKTNRVDADIIICPVAARYVKYAQPPDGSWNGWGKFFQLRAYALLDEG